MNIAKLNLIVAAGFLLALPFARAQACDPDFPGEILHACGNPDLMQLESDAVTTWLQAHYLPTSAKDILYTYGRADIRNQIRGLMFDDLLRVIQEDPATRNSHDQALYSWFEGLVDNLEVAQYQLAATDANLWENASCGWRPDPDVAAAYGLSYNPIPWCSGNFLITAFSSGPPVPSKSYFLAAALKNTYGAAVTSTPYGSATEESVELEGYRMFGYAAAPAVIFSAGSSVLTYQYFVNSPKTSTLRETQAMRRAAQKTISDLARAATRSFTTADDVQAATEAAVAEETSSAALDFAGGPAAVVLLAIEIGVQAGFQFISHSDAVNEVNSIASDRDSLIANGVNLQDFVLSDVGMHKLSAAFTAQTLPDTPSTQPLPEHRAGVDPHFVLQDAKTGTRSDADTLTYTDLAGTNWSVQTYEGFFLETGTMSDGTMVQSISPTLTITDPNGVSWDVDWTGNTFLLTKAEPGDNDARCAANPLTGVSDGGDVQTGHCSSYVAHSFNLQDSTVVSLGQGPVFTSASIAGFPVGPAFSVSVTATGAPTPAIGPVGGHSPYFTLQGGANGSLTVSGRAGIPEGTYQISLQATNGTGRATETLTIVVGIAPQFVSPAQLTDNGGVATTFTIRVAGTLPMTISLGPDFVIPRGYTFHDNGNGTATISGTDGGGLCYVLPGLPIPGGGTGSDCTNTIGGTVLASNSVGSASQQLTIQFVGAPEVFFAGPSDATFTPGIENSLTITTYGATTPVSITNSAPLPSWMGFQDNGNGTATYSGRPPLTATSYDVDTGVDPVASGFAGVIFPGNVTIHVSAAPVFLDTGSQLWKVCPLGETCTLDVHTNMAAGMLSLTGDVPGGITLMTSGPAEGELALPGNASGGAYRVTVHANNSFGSVDQIYTFYKLQGPTFPTATPNAGGFAPLWNMDIWLMERVPVSFSIPTTGYPHDIGLTTPGGTTILPSMRLSIQQGLYSRQFSQGLNFTDTTSAGIPTGTGLISGTPAEGSEGTYQIEIDATNSPILGAILLATVHVRAPGDVNGDGQIDCTDVNMIRAALGSHPEQASYNVRADINNDGTVNVVDLALVARYLPRTCTP